MDKDGCNYNAITCTTWIPRGVAKQNPEKIELSKEELAKIISETRENIEDLDELEEKDFDDLEVEALKEDLRIPTSEEQNAKTEDVEMEDEEANTKSSHLKMGTGENEDIEKKYNFAEYDEEKDGLEALFKLGKLTVHASNEEDPNITVKDEDSDSEVENKKILPTDNLIAVGHVDGDAAVLEVHVYNNEENSFYVHHDFLLPAVPFCMEWLNVDPEEENLKPGNLLAIGSMSPIIEVWDLDLMDCLEPAYVLGRRPKKKKNMSRVGHSDAVLCLGWNKNLYHILASGSVDKSIILWDLEKCSEAQKFTQFSGEVQDLRWHPEESHYLLSGSCDKTVRLFDFVTEENNKVWNVDGEVESVLWDPTSSHCFQFYASTDKGTVYAMDARQEKPLRKINAHRKACTGMVMNPQCPGMLVTVSEDTSVKIWDVLGSEVKQVEERHPNLGVIHTVASSPDCPFVLSIGGDNKNNNLKVWDIRQSQKVRRGFFDRLGLSVEDEEEIGDMKIENEDDEDEYVDMGKEEASASSNKSQWKPPKKSKKVKGGHSHKRKKKR